MKLRLVALAAGSLLSIYLLFLMGSVLPRWWGHLAQNRSQSRQTLPESGCQYQVCAARFGIHTNIIVPVANGAFNWQDKLSLTLTSGQYVGFGWGERDWYLNPPPDGSLSYYLRGVRSLLWLNPAALRVQRHDGFPENYEIRCVGVERSDYLALMQYIQQSFQRSAEGNQRLIREEDAAGSAFYEATGRYSLLHNSNHWTAEGLHIAGVNTPLWAGFSEGVMRQIQPTCNPSHPKE